MIGENLSGVFSFFLILQREEEKRAFQDSTFCHKDMLNI